MFENIKVVLRDVANFFDAATGKRHARVVFEAPEQVVTADGLKAHTRIELTVVGEDAVRAVERIKSYGLTLVPHVEQEVQAVAAVVETKVEAVVQAVEAAIGIEVIPAAVTEAPNAPETPVEPVVPETTEEPVPAPVEAPAEASVAEAPAEPAPAVEAVPEAPAV